jgi:hypothetical protein
MATRPAYVWTGSDWDDIGDKRLGASVTALESELGSKLDTSAYTAPGLELITSESFSAVSSLTISNCFSATYANYVITMDANGLVSAQLRTGSTTATTNYSDQFAQVSNTTYNQGRRTAQSSAYFSGGTGESWASTTRLFNPAVAVATSWETQEANKAAPVFRHYTGLHTTATAYESIVLTVGAGTMSGTIRIYGLKNN